MRRRLLLQLWRILPLPRRLRWLVLWRVNAHFMAGAAALIRDEEGRVLLFYHSYRPQHPWGLPGGFLRSDERLEVGLQRELREEAGFEISDLQLLVADLEVRERHIDLIYSCRLQEQHFRPSDEVLRYGYFPADALPDISPEQRQQLQRALRRDDERRTATASGGR